MSADEDFVCWRDCRDRFQFETTLLDLSTRFISIPTDELDAAIVDAQRRVCECLDVDVSTLWRIPADQPGTMLLTHSFSPPDFPPVPMTMDAQEVSPWCLNRLRNGESIVVSRLSDAPPEAERDCALWKQYGVKSVLTLPLSAGGQATFGALNFCRFREERVWDPHLVDRLSFVAQMFASALARQVTERALRESTGMLEMATAAADMGHWVLNVAGDRFWVTTRVMEMFGLPPGNELELHRFLALVHPDDRALVREAMDHAAESSGMHVVEYRLARPDGTSRWMRSSGRMISRAKGQPARLMGITADITDQKQKEEALRSSEARVTSAIEVSGMGFYEIGENGRVTFIDAQLRRILGMPPGDDVDVRDFWLAHIHREHQQEILDASRDMLSGVADRVSKTYRYEHPSGQLMWFHHLARSLAQNEAGRLIHGMGVVWDITDRKHAETESLELRRELAHVTRVYALGELASSMAHELNQPLAAIIANSDAAEIHARAEKPPIEEIQNILDDIRRDGMRAGDIIHRMRGFLQRREVEMQLLDVDHLVRESVKFVEMDAAVRKITVQYHVEPDLLPGHGDRIQLQQVLLNLMVNGMDAMNGDSGGTHILSINARRESDELIEISVADKGHGIQPDKLSQVFEPFYTTKRSGLGMGLAISRTIVDAHGGRLWLENNPTGGATARFTIPIHVGGKRP